MHLIPIKSSFDRMKLLFILNLFSPCLTLPFRRSPASTLGAGEYDDLLYSVRKTAPTKYNFMGEISTVMNPLKYHMGQPVLTDPVDIFCKIMITESRYLLRELV